MFNSYTENTLLLEKEKCINCGICIELCPHDVFSSEGKSIVISTKSNCIECGACMLNCPKNAIYVESGAGCAYGLMISAITGSTKCDCSGNNANFSSAGEKGEQEEACCSCCGK